jgi:hypothetical protein
MEFRTIDGLSIRFAESEERDDDALLLGPWPERLLVFEPTWEDGADEYATLVTAWWAGGYATAASAPAR